MSWPSGEISTLAKLANEFVEGLSSIASFHVGKGLFQRANRFAKFLGRGLLRTPKIERFFGRNIRCGVAESLANELMELSKFAVESR